MIRRFTWGMTAVSAVVTNFSDNNINNGHFDYYRPAAVLLHPSTAPAVPSSDTLDLAEELFAKVNSVIEGGGPRR